MGFRICLCRSSSRFTYNCFSAVKWSKVHELVLRKTKKNKPGRGMGANHCPQTC